MVAGDIKMKTKQSQIEARTYETWNEALDCINLRIGKQTKSQLRFAGKHQSRISKLPFIVAAAVLQDMHGDILDFKSTTPSPSLLLTLEERWEIAFPKKKSPTPISTSREVSAWIEYTYLSSRKSALTRLKLHKGDIVKNMAGTFYEVRSVGSDGRVYFRGGHGQRAWPDGLTIVERYDPKVKTAVRKQVENETSERIKRKEWSDAKHKVLSKFSVPKGSDLTTALEAAYTALESAKDERPLQNVFANFPILLARLLTRSHGIYLWDRPKLGSEFIPDFVIADVDSAGIHYKLVELESPTAKMFLKDGNLGQHTRDGINQIQNWRAWLESNISYARTSQADSGLGFLDIAAKPPGLIIIGRQNQMAGTNEARRKQSYDQNNIEIRTYDGILQDIEARL